MFTLFTVFADVITFDLLGLAPQTGVAQAVHFFIEDTSKIFVLLILIVFAMGLVRTVVSPQRVRTYLDGKTRGGAYLLAVLLGAVTPFCSCSSVPLFIGFLEGGIPLGVTMAFLITSPLVNEVAVVILGAVVGWQITALYALTGMAIGALGGVLIDRLHMERHVEEAVWSIRMGAAPDLDQQQTWRSRVRRAWADTKSTVSRIWIYVLGGIGVGALLHGFVPSALFATYATADNPLAVPVAVLFGLPLYANATGFIPVAEALLNKGVPFGTVIAFMMSTVALSPPEFIMLRKVLKPRLLIWLAVYLGGAFIAVGYGLNLGFGEPWRL